MSQTILQPVVALLAWSMVMWAWLYATRIPAIAKAKVAMEPSMTTADLNQHLPASVRWKADNYNHLMEQPTLFYAVALTLALLDQGHGVNTWIAWGYVALRVVHSLVQALTNVILVRFLVFMVSSLALLALVLHAALAVF
ncbi:MAG: MAPEG family protein [Phenylobacterium sp.]|uniref:MAPEG family protein n=1 Tax=Phenylobacterium sp. TaxID=1871053 RepID=UPI00121304A7|nr:MAPEG family protein [Phenylobacterium sp.]TAL37683.1 MAG: MAPEG family protein [Phenylobacterium sp.]